MNNTSPGLGIAAETSDSGRPGDQIDVTGPTGGAASRWLDALATPRAALPFLLAFGTVLVIVNLGAYPSYTKGEPREAVRILDIIRGGGWILPTQQGIGLPWKPPLMYWLGAFISMVFGTVNEWTVRLPSGMLGVGSIVCCYLYVRRLFNDRSALVAALILATSFQFEQAATAARVDMTLTFFMEIAFFEFIAIAEGLTRRRMLLYAAMAAAVLAKGPIGVALPAITILVWIALERRWSLMRDLKIVRGVLLIAIVAGSWYAAATLIGGHAFVHRQILDENFYRLFPSRAVHEPHRHPFYFMELALLAGYLPWTGLAGLALLAIPDRARKWNPRLKYLVVWTATVLVFYNLPRSKRGIYLLALYPALATLTALMLDAVRSRTANRPRVLRLTAMFEGLPFTAIGLAMLAVEAALWLRGPQLFASAIRPLGVRVPEFSVKLSQAFGGHPLIAVLLPAVACASGVYLLLTRPDIDKLFSGVLTAICCSILVAHIFVVPAIGRTLTLKYFTQETMKIADGRTVVDLGSTNFDIAFYSGRNIRIGSLTKAHNADFFICWQRHYRVLPEADRRRLSIVMTSTPTSLSGRGRMLLLKRSDLPTALRSWAKIASGSSDATSFLPRPFLARASTRGTTGGCNPG